MENKYNFIFLYEVKNREFESIVLLKYELEKLGYTVFLLETWENLNKRKKHLECDVLVSFALYNDDTLRFVLSYVDSCKKVVNLQWEQVFTNGDRDRIRLNNTSNYSIKGQAKFQYHISWGRVNYDSLTVHNKIPAENICLAGNVSLDFLRPEFLGYYKSRDFIEQEFSLDPSKKIYLFISSFSFTNFPENYLDSDLYKNLGYDLKEFVDINKKSQSILLDWFEVELKKHGDIQLIYRPHPTEVQNARLVELNNKYNNFYVISELSLKQWILVVDKIYTWWSTSVAELYVSGKNCSILRPVDIPYKTELEVYNGCDFIKSFDRFDKEYLDSCSFPISDEVMNSYYFIDKNEASYKKIIRFLEYLVKEDTDVFLVNKKRTVIRTSLSIIKKLLLSSFYSCSGPLLSFFSGYKLKLKKKQEEQAYISKMVKENCYKKEEEYLFIQRLKNIQR